MTLIVLSFPNQVFQVPCQVLSKTRKSDQFLLGSCTTKCAFPTCDTTLPDITFSTGKPGRFPSHQLSAQTPVAVDPSTCLITFRVASSTPGPCPWLGFSLWTARDNFHPLAWKTCSGPGGILGSASPLSAGHGAQGSWCSISCSLRLFQKLCFTIPSILPMPKWVTHGLHSSSSCWWSLADPKSSHPRGSGGVGIPTLTVYLIMSK